MTSQPTLRRQDQPIQIGPRHGYRIEGDHAFINAELQVPPAHSGGEHTLELWASEQPYSEGPLTGVQVAQLALELPTPIGPHVHQVDARTAARLPLQGRAYPMVLALVQRSPDGHESVRAFANYAEPQVFTVPRFVGCVGYRVQGAEVVLEADAIANPRAQDNLSGTLSLELRAFPASGPSASKLTDGLRLAASEVERVAGQFELPAIERRVAFSEPPVGQFRLALLLCEWTLTHGYVVRDRRDFATIYERSARELAGPSPALPPEAPAAAARPAEKLRLVSTPSEASPPAVSAAFTRTAPPAAPTLSPPSGLVSIQTASAEELAAVKGLNLKIAKEIVRARPFSSLADLIRVRGLGEKSIARLKGLLSL